MTSPDVSLQTYFRPELRATLRTTVLCVRVDSLKVVHHVSFACEGLPTVSADKSGI